MSDFRPLDQQFWASPQISEAEVLEARDRGIRMIVNNRPENEAEGQPPGARIEAAARAAGLDYVAIPITHAGFDEEQVQSLVAAMRRADGPILAYCRSGTRSTFLWALASAVEGGDPAKIAAEASAAGYDVSPIAPLIEMLAARTRS